MTAVAEMNETTTVPAPAETRWSANTADDNGDCNSPICLQNKRENRTHNGNKYKLFYWCQKCRTNVKKMFIRCPCCSQALRRKPRTVNRATRVKQNSYKVYI